MFTPDHYRAKAAEYAELARTASRPDEQREFRRRQRSFTVLADNEQWLADHHDQTVHVTGAANGNAPAPVMIGDVGSQAQQ